MKETLPLSRYLRKERVRSKIDPEYIFYNIIGIDCPHCDEELPNLEHGERQTCDRCGLEMQVFGASLVCTLKE